jgi:hypothetical protein
MESTTTRVVLAGAVLGAGFALLRSMALSSNKASRRGASPQVQRIVHAATGVRSCGIDIGGSSCKVAADCVDGSLLLMQWPTAALADAIAWVQDGDYAVAGTTGGLCPAHSTCIACAVKHSPSSRSIVHCMCYNAFTRCCAPHVLIHSVQPALSPQAAARSSATSCAQRLERLAAWRKWSLLPLA